MLHRLRWRHGLHAPEAAAHPSVTVSLPGERRLVPAAVVEERRVVGIRYRLDVDPVRAGLGVVGGTLVVVGPGLVVRAHHERPLLDDGGAETARQHPWPSTFVPDPGQLDRLQHRFHVLLFVLDDEAEGEAAAEQRVRGVELDLLEHRERPRANVGEVRACSSGIEELERGPLLPLVRERVVCVVHLGEDRLCAPEPPGDPELLEVPDVREVPDERRHEGRDLPGELLVGERREQRSRPGPRGL